MAFRDTKFIPVLITNSWQITVSIADYLSGDYFSVDLFHEMSSFRLVSKKKKKEYQIIISEWLVRRR